MGALAYMKWYFGGSNTWRTFQNRRIDIDTSLSLVDWWYDGI